MIPTRWFPFPAGLLLLLLSCSAGDRATNSGRTATGRTAAGAAALTGAGATFPNPIYTKWFDAYNKETGVRINYQSIGSGGGIRQFTEGTVDFGASDAPMTDAQMDAVKGNVLHVPTVLGAVVATYNLPSAGKTALKLDGPTLADIFLGRISRWNDPRLASLNPGVKLPAIRTSSWSIAPMAAVPPLSSPITCRRSPPSGRERSARAPRCSGPPVWAARAMKVSPSRSSRPRARSATLS